MVEMKPNRLTRVTEAVPDDLARVYRPLATLHAVAAAEAVGRIDSVGIDPAA